MKPLIGFFFHLWTLDHYHLLLCDVQHTHTVFQLDHKVKEIPIYILNYICSETSENQCILSVNDFSFSNDFAGFLALRAGPQASAYEEFLKLISSLFYGLQLIVNWILGASAPEIPTWSNAVVAVQTVRVFNSSVRFGVFSRRSVTLRTKYIQTVELY